MALGCHKSGRSLAVPERERGGGGADKQTEKYGEGGVGVEDRGKEL